MSIRDEKAAVQHPAYDDALRQAVKMAAEGSSAAVYWDGAGIAVRSCYAPKPPEDSVICIAERWDERTIQLRFAGARSEWVTL